MERKTSIEIARKIMGHHFIGSDEIRNISSSMDLNIPDVVPEIPFTQEQLLSHAKSHLLVLCLPEFKTGKTLNIISLRDHFGLEPDMSEPCFYNQDWYVNEDFVKRNLPLSWVLLRKNVIEETRAVDPNIIKQSVNLPSAVVCCYAFFITTLIFQVPLWPYDFVWCSDLDINGDRIYVGRYYDVKRVNKNGFSIHRHLSLRANYASIDIL